MIAVEIFVGGEKGIVQPVTFIGVNAPSTQHAPETRIEAPQGRGLASLLRKAVSRGEKLLSKPSATSAI